MLVVLVAMALAGAVDRATILRARHALIAVRGKLAVGILDSFALGWSRRSSNRRMSASLHGSRRRAGQTQAQGRSKRCIRELAHSVLLTIELFINGDITTAQPEPNTRR